MTDLVPFRRAENDARPIAEVIPEEASTDERVLVLRLHGRPANTPRAYGREADTFLSDVRKPLRAVTLADLQAYADRRANLAPATRARSLNALRSLFRFAQRIGCLGFNPAAALRVPVVENVLAARILEEVDVQRMIGLQTDARDRVLLRLFYAAGLRACELAGSTLGGHATPGRERAGDRHLQVE